MVGAGLGDDDSQKAKWLFEALRAVVPVQDDRRQRSSPLSRPRPRLTAEATGSHKLDS